VCVCVRMQSHCGVDRFHLYSGWGVLSLLQEQNRLCLFLHTVMTHIRSIDTLSLGSSQHMSTFACMAVTAAWQKSIPQPVPLHLAGMASSAAEQTPASASTERPTVLAFQTPIVGSRSRSRSSHARRYSSGSLRRRELQHLLDIAVQNCERVQTDMAQDNWGLARRSNLKAQLAVNKAQQLLLDDHLL